MTDAIKTWVVKIWRAACIFILEEKQNELHRRIMMKTSATLAAAILMLSAIPVIADDSQKVSKPEAAPTPSSVQYEVWGYRWDGRQYVKQPNYTLQTTDLKKASDYVAHINSFQGWTATTNMPDICLPQNFLFRPKINSQQQSAAPAALQFSIWAFQLTDGQWVKDDKYCWTTTDPLKGAEYAKKVNAVKGWTATDNCPQAAPRTQQQYVYGHPGRGGRVYIDINSLIRDALNGSLRTNAVPGDNGTAWDPSWSNSVSVESTSTPVYDNSADIQNMINIQNMLNTQDMINTQNMVNNLQDMVNSQNMVNEQNMINSMNSNP
jgi:hypothetical protein